MTKEAYITKDLEVFSSDGLISYPLYKVCENKIVVIKLFRRFGCPFTRLDAQEFSQLKGAFRDLDVELVGIGFDEEGISEFKEWAFWNGELYLDKDRKIYDFFKLEKISKISLIRNLFRKDTKEFYKELSQELGGNLSGDTLQLGGALVLSNKGKVIYKSLQKDYAQKTPISEILHACQVEHAIQNYKSVHLNSPDLIKETHSI